MTKFGKILVFANLTLSLLFATWAVAVYSQRIDYSERKKVADDERTWGETAKLKKELESWNGDGKTGRRPWAETRMLSALGELRAAEKLRLDNQAWYADQLATLVDGATGKKIQSAEPVKRVSFTGGSLDVEKNGLPRLVTVNDKSNQPLKPKTGLIKQQADLNAQIEKVQGEILALRKEATGLTLQIEIAFRDIERAAQARRGSVEEQRYLERVLYNVMVEGEMLLDRGRELEVRLKELQSSRATSRNR